MKSYLFLLALLSCLGCKHKNDPAPITNFGNVVILGNSITFAAPDPSIGWTGNWGMAASSEAQDYAHILGARLRKYNDTCKVQVKNIGDFEENYGTYDFDANLKSFRDSKPDLLILRIGDNVESSFDPVLFMAKYQALITYMKSGNTNLKVLSVGPFVGGKSYVSDIMVKFQPYISLESVGDVLGNYASYLNNVSSGVKQHPGDAGMQAISDLIWAQIRTM